MDRLQADAKDLGSFAAGYEISLNRFIHLTLEILRGSNDTRICIATEYLLMPPGVGHG